MKPSFARSLPEGTASAMMFNYIGLNPQNVSIIFYMIAAFISASKQGAEDGQQSDK